MTPSPFSLKCLRYVALAALLVSTSGQAYTLAGANKWKTATPVPLAYNPSGQPSAISMADVVKMIQQSAQAWSAVCGISFNYTGITARNSYPSNEYVLWWSTYGYYHDIDSSNGFIYQGYYGIYAAEYQSPSWLTSTFLRAIGYGIGLNQSGDPSSVMYSNAAWGQNSPVVLSQDDIDGCQAMYGPPVTPFAIEDVGVLVGETKNITTSGGTIRACSSRDTRIATVSNNSSVTGIQPGFTKLACSDTNGISKESTIAVVAGALGSSTCDTTTPYNQGYFAAQAACKTNPSSCGIASTPGTGTTTACSHATYSPIDNKVHIPLLDVPTLFGGTPVVYEVDLAIMPSTNPLQLKLQDAKLVP